MGKRKAQEKARHDDSITKQKKGAEKRFMGEISMPAGEVMTQGTACYFSTAIVGEDGRVHDLTTGNEWDSVEAWHAERCDRAATLTYAFPCSPERLAASVDLHDDGRGAKA